MSISARTQDAARRKHRNSAPAINKTLFFAVVLHRTFKKKARCRYKTRAHLFQINIFKLYEQHWGNLSCKRRKRNSRWFLRPRLGMETITAEPLNAPAPWKSGVNQPVARSRGPQRLAANGRNRQPQWPIEFWELPILVNPTAGIFTNGHRSSCGDQREDADLQDHAHCYWSVSSCSYDWIETSVPHCPAL